MHSDGIFGGAEEGKNESRRVTIVVSDVDDTDIYVKFKIMDKLSPCGSHSDMTQLASISQHHMESIWSITRPRHCTFAIAVMIAAASLATFKRVSEYS
jgi:hypothetical protein